MAGKYGGYGALKTGWVSNILFEPSVGERFFEELCSAESQLTVVKKARFTSLAKKAKGWSVSFVKDDGSAVTYDCDILIDATELGEGGRRQVQNRYGFER